MTTRLIYSSVTRNIDLARSDFAVSELPREQWRAGDVVVGEIEPSAKAGHNVELVNGRMAEAAAGDRIVGAFGDRAATLEAVGSWRDIGEDGRFDALTPAGLFGKCTSKSVFLGPLMPLGYRGHLVHQDRKLNLQDFTIASKGSAFAKPVIMIAGTSMSAGKTTSGRLIIRLLRELGLKVAAAKVTGAARYRDVLTYADAGAEPIFDFIDIGVASSVGPADEFAPLLQHLLSAIQDCDAEVIVIEAGASPLEPYNGSTAITALKDHIRFLLVCASDPYAVTGLIDAFDMKPDLIAGGAANTSAGIDLVRNLTGIECLNLLEREGAGKLKSMLEAALAGSTG